MKRQKFVQHFVQILYPQKILRKLVTHILRPIQPKLPVQAKQLKVDMNVCQIEKELTDLV